MAYRWVEHTAELELALEGPTEAAVFAAALAALAELLGEGAAGEPVELELSLSARDGAALLASWLDELVYRAETEDLIPEAAERLTIEGGALRARVRARRGRPRHLVKGVTYHRLSLAPAQGGYRATVVLDV
jgi:SHS2 domain-containing protein